MPGLVGLVGSCATLDKSSSAANSINHFDDYFSKRCSPLNNVEIAQVWRNSTETAGSWHHDGASGASAFVNGTVIKPGIRPKPMHADDVLQAYMSDSLAPETYDGSFIIVIANKRTRQLIVCNDRLGTLPCYYYSDSSSFCFGPEAKAIFSAIGLIPEYSVNGLITFLTLGYCLADTTLFSSIHCLEPASRLVINASTATFALHRYWCMKYEPAPGLRSRRRAEEALYESIMAGHSSVFSSTEKRYDLLLSGGWDSRGMLAAAHKLGHMPRRSISWGLRDDVPLSDPFLAAQLAERYGVDHRFISYDTDAFINNATQWSYMTELNTDNFGWYGEGTNILLNEYAGNVDFMLAGDECWGFGPHVRNQVEAMASCLMPAPFPKSLAGCLSARLIADCSDIYTAEIDKVLRMCASKDPNDRKDFLQVHGRVARFIFSLGYYKELAVEIRRPFLSTHVVDVIQKLPVKFRYGKNLYISTLIRYFPELLLVNKRAAGSLPEWRRDLRENPELSRYFAGLLSSQTLAQTSFAEHLDLQEIEKKSAKFFAAPRTERNREANRSARMGRWTHSIKQQLTAYDDIRLALHLRKPAARQLDDFDLLRRVALLALLDQNLSRFSKPPLSNQTGH